MLILYFVFPKQMLSWSIWSFPPEVKSINSVFHNLTQDLFIDQGGYYPIKIYKKLLRAMSPKIGKFARVIKSSRDHVCTSADAIASDRLRKTKRPEGPIIFVHMLEETNWVSNIPNCINLQCPCCIVVFQAIIFCILCNFRTIQKFISK